MSPTKDKTDAIPRISYRKFLNRRKKRNNLFTDESNPENTAKRYLKFLSVCRDGKAASAVLKSSPDSVIKRICDAALNAAEGDIPIDLKRKKIFARKRKIFKTLVDPKIPIPRKRRLLSNQKGGALPIIPILLSTVLSTVGSLLFNRKSE